MTIFERLATWQPEVLIALAQRGLLNLYELSADIATVNIQHLMRSARTYRRVRSRLRQARGV